MRDDEVKCDGCPTVGRRPRKRVGYLYLPPDTDPPAPEGVGGLGPRLVKKKIYKIFQIFHHIESLDVCMEY